MRFSGTRLRALREARGMTRPVMAKRYGLTEYTIRNLEIGTREPGGAVLLRIADALNVRPESLYDRDDALTSA
jgi:transcriptional regulator with XRE-family HTH domain